MISKPNVGTNSKGRRGLASSCRKKFSQGETLEPQGQGSEETGDKVDFVPSQKSRPNPDEDGIGKVPACPGDGG